MTFYLTRMTVCRGCIGHWEDRDGLAWVVDVPDPSCPTHKEKK